MKTCKLNNRSNRLFLITVFFGMSLSFGQSFQQEEKKQVKEINKLLKTAEKELSEGDFPEAEAAYRRAVSKRPENPVPKYNMANMYYGKDKVSQAASRYIEAAKTAETKEAKHKAFHNLGNAFMKQKKYKAAVEAYKDALRNAPGDEETRYNLALAKKMLEENPEDPEGGGDDEKDQEQNQDQDKEQQGDQGEKKEQEQKEGDNKKDQGQQGEDNKDPKEEGSDGKPRDQQKEQGGEEKEQPASATPQPGQLSPEQIKRLLEAMNNEEKKVQEKINARKAKGSGTKNEKDW